MNLAFQFGNANTTEILWTLIGLVGLYFNIGNLKETRKNINAIHVMNGKNIKRVRELRIIAYGHFRNETFRVAKTSTIIFIGVVGMMLPNTVSRVTVTGVIVTVGLFVIEMLIVLPGILDRRQREILLAEDEENKKL